MSGLTLALVVAAVLASDGGVDAGVLDAGVKLGPCREKQTVCFSPLGQCHLSVIDVIDRATASVDVAIYSLNHAGIVDALLRAKAKGRAVRVVLDSSQMGSTKEVEQLLRLQAAGIPLKRDTHSGIMHMKVVVVDGGREFVTGSFNFTNNASLNNNENVFAWDCPRNAALYQAEFDRMWSTFKPAVVSVADAG
jgi:phosphatidylserine/phosphatidylglycerophosphate/cardiolipin synthase-like enzyme